MKITEKKKQKKRNLKNRAVVKPKKEKVLIVAQEIKFARLLSGNEKKIRDRALKTLKKWLTNCFQKGYEFKEDDFLRIWKGLFYAVWMSDKPLIQEELCESISGILDLFPPEQYRHALLLVRVGLQTMATEWYGIDHHRMDKCLMLVRRYLRGSLRCVARSGWSEEACKMYAKMLSGQNGILALKTPLFARNATSMILHFIDCYLEEIAKVSQGDIPPQSVLALLRPFCSYMGRGESTIICASCRRLLAQLIRQSEEGIKYQHKASAWQQMGCPEGGPDALQEVSDDDGDEQASDEENDDEQSEKPLDPRAGRVNVELPTLPVPAEEIATLLTELRQTALRSAVKRINIYIKRFQELAKNEYPLKVEAVSLDVGPKLPPPEKAIQSLASLEKQLVTSSDELALRGLSRKHRKRLLAKSRAGMSIVEDAALLTSTRNNGAGDWQVEDANQETIKSKKRNANKENVDKKRKKRKLEQNGFAALKKPKIDSANNEKSKNKTKNTNSKNELEQKANFVQKSLETKTILKEKEKPQPKELKPQPLQLKTKNVETLKRSDSTINKKEKKSPSQPSVISKKIKNFQKQLSPKTDSNASVHTPKKVKFVLKNNSMQGTMDYYKSIRQSPNIPFDSTKTPSKTNLKPSTPSPINPFFKRKWKINN